MIISLIVEHWPRRQASPRGPTGKKIPTVAHLWHAGSAKKNGRITRLYSKAFSRPGYVDGRAFRLLHRFPDDVPERLRSMAADLVSMTSTRRWVVPSPRRICGMLRNHPNCLHVHPDPVGTNSSKAWRGRAATRLDSSTSEATSLAAAAASPGRIPAYRVSGASQIPTRSPRASTPRS